MWLFEHCKHLLLKEGGWYLYSQVNEGWSDAVSHSSFLLRYSDEIVIRWRSYSIFLLALPLWSAKCLACGLEILTGNRSWTFITRHLSSLKDERNLSTVLICWWSHYYLEWTMYAFRPQSHQFTQFYSILAFELIRYISFVFFMS